MKKSAIFLLGLILMLLPLKAKSQEAYAWLSSDGMTFTFCYDNQKASRAGKTYSLSEEWTDDIQNVERVEFNSEFANVKPTSTSGWFKNMNKLIVILNLDFLDTSDVRDMSEMFYYCNALRSINLSNFNTEKVTNMSFMFNGCKELGILNVSKFKTENVTNMRSMFDGCINVRNLDVSKFKTENVTNMAFMFQSCSSLTSLDVSNFDTENVTNMAYMFNGCNSLTSLDVSNFNMSKVKNSDSILGNCTLLQTLKISPSMANISGNACIGVGSSSNPCILFAPDDFDFGEGVDTSGDYFEWKSGYFKLNNVKIIISDNGVATFCYDKDLDFSGVTDYKAYVAGGYNSKTGKVTLVRVNDVPAGTGIILTGTPGMYEVPAGESESILTNLLIGTTEKTNIQPTDGDNTNFVLSVKNGKVGFYTFTKAFDLAANKAYLQIPTSALGTAANGMGLEFDDETNDIDGVESEMQPDVVWYTIDGRKLDAKPTQKGLYIANGRKIVVK